MHIRTIRIYRFTLDFRAPLHMAGREMRVREGLLVRVESAAGACGWGEISPFGNLHRESTAQALAQLQEIRGSLIGHRLDTEPAALFAFVGELVPAGCLYPSVRFGMETALLNLAAAAQGISMAQLLGKWMGKPAMPHITLNGLLAGPPGDMPARAAALQKDGYRSIKIKVGRGSIAEEVSLVRRARNVLGPEPGLRLDANRSWTLAEALHFTDALADCAIEYIEEPLAAAADLPTFAAHSAIPPALDESLHEYSLTDLPRIPGLAALVLKPQVAGGPGRVLAYREYAERHKLKLVLSSVFESSVGLCAIAAVAAAGGQDTAMGLDTWRYLAGDVCHKGLAVEHGRIAMDEALHRACEVDTQRLAEL